MWLFLFSIIIRFAAIGLEALWYDEAFTGWLVQLPFDKLMAAMLGDTHPPLWYGIEFLVSHVFGDSPLALRSPAALFGSGAVVVLYFIVKQLTDDKSARYASGLMAVSPAQLYYSQEARMYSLLTLLVLAGIWLVLNRRWFLLSLVLALIPYTQTLGVIYCGILAAWALWTSRGRMMRYLTLPILAYIPQALITLSQARQFATGYWIADPGNIGGLFYPIYFTTFFIRLPTVLAAHGVLFSFLASAGALLFLRGRLLRLLPLIIIAFAPMAILYGISVTLKPVMVDRYVLPSGAAILSLWGIAAANLPSWAKKPAAAIALPMLAASVITYFIDPQDQRQNNFPATDIIKDHWQPGDVIYHHRITSLIEYEPYLQGLPSYTTPETGQLIGNLSDPTKLAMGIKAREKPIDQLGPQFRRVWFIAEDSIITNSFEIAYEQQILARYRVLQQWPLNRNKFRSLTLYLLELP